MPQTTSGKPMHVDEPLNSTDLAALLLQIAAGSEVALGQLYEALSASVLGLASRILRDRLRAEDVAQEVFLQVWQSASRFDAARGTAKTWVLTIAHRRAVDAVRHDQAARNRERNYCWSSGPDFDQVQEAVILTFEQTQVRRCLDGLSDLQREAVNLAYYEGHTYAEVADKLGVKRATIKTRMRDGIVRLRDCMEPAFT